MSGSTIYFRPATAQPYHILRAAQWLARIGRAKSAEHAWQVLVSLETHRPDLFRFIMAESHRVHQFRVGYLGGESDVDSSDINAFRSVEGPYGTDAHMYYRRE